mgnify:CR=1 FL=1
MTVQAAPIHSETNRDSLLASTEYPGRCECRTLIPAVRYVLFGSRCSRDHVAHFCRRWSKARRPRLPAQATLFDRLLDLFLSKPDLAVIREIDQRQINLIKAHLLT